MFSSRLGKLNAAELETKERVAAHRKRCQNLPPLRENEAKRLVAEFLIASGGRTICPPASAALFDLSRRPAGMRDLIGLEQPYAPSLTTAARGQT
jgi:hypothetical protein